jgi:hypothetical protein
MTPQDLIVTSVVLGLFVLAGGCYGTLYSAAILRSSRQLMRTAYACYAVQVALAVLVCGYTPLTLPWKLLIVLSAVAYVFIPVLAWRYMDGTHRMGEQAP